MGRGRQQTVTRNSLRAKLFPPCEEKEGGGREDTGGLRDVIAEGGLQDVCLGEF